MLVRRLIAMLILGPILTALATICVVQAQTLSKTADNGPEMRLADNVIVVPDKNARSVTGWLIVRAGCADEANGQCVGIAHYLEHLLFINRDADNRAKVAFFPDGSGNGWTTHRTTVYFQRFPSRQASDGQNLDKLLGYFAGLLSDVRVDAAQAERERNVVMQEYQQNTGRNPFARFAIRLNAALMPGDPLGQRVIGSPETIKSFRPEVAKLFHDTWYVRDNVAVVLHGPIEPAQVGALIERHFAKLPNKSAPPHAWKQPRTYETGFQLIRSTEKDARQSAVYLERLVTFDETASDEPVNETAASVLNGYLSSRLKDSPGEVLVERDSVFTDARLAISRVRRGAWRVSFSGVPAEGVDLDRALAAARAYLHDLPRRGLPHEVVDRLKMRIRNERALLAQQPALYAQALTNWLSAHQSYEAWGERAARLSALTAADVDALLSRLAGPAREVAGLLLPGSPRPGIAEPAPSGTAPTPSVEMIPQ